MTTASSELARLYVQPELNTEYLKKVFKYTILICKSFWEMPKGAIFCPEAFASRLDKAINKLNQLFETNPGEAKAICEKLISFLPMSCESIEVGTKEIHTCDLNPSYDAIMNFMSFLFDKCSDYEIVPLEYNNATRLDEKATGIRKFDNYLSGFLRKDYLNKINSNA